MNPRNIGMMSKKIRQWCDVDHDSIVIDVGAYDVNGNLRPAIPDRWTYIGVDRVTGPNVDTVMPDDYTIPYEFADVIISTSCFQYVRNPFKLMQEINDTLPTGGIVIICAGRIEAEGMIGLPDELCPDGDPSFDCWRYLKGGMTALLEDSGFDVLDVTHQDGGTTWGVGRAQ